MYSTAEVTSFEQNSDKSKTLGLFAAIRQYFVTRKTVDSLNRLTDRQLEDIGLVRSDIPSRVQDFYRSSI